MKHDEVARDEIVRDVKEIGQYQATKKNKTKK